MSVATMAKAAVRSRVKGSLWDHPAARAALPLADYADARALRRHGYSDLPPFSIRVRSNGFEGQFGGEAFTRLGDVIADDLERHADLTADSRVLDVGCGAGRVAIALARRYPDLAYTGLDIDGPQIDACRANPLLAEFTFELADVESDLYNGAGAESAETYRLPFGDAALDVVFLVSVFTHMWPSACGNYAREFVRVLRPGGACAVTTHLLNEGEPRWHVVDDAHVRWPATPLKMVGQTREQLAGFFGREPETVLRGTWHGDGLADHAFAQDMLIFRA